MMDNEQASSETLSKARNIASEATKDIAGGEAYAAYLEREEYSEKALMEFARFLIRHSQGRQAELVLRLALETNGANIDALELYLELVRELKLPVVQQRWAIKRLREDIGEHPSSLRGSLDYAIPSKLHTILELAENSSDPINRAVARINHAYAENADVEAALHLASNELGTNDVLRAHLTVTLGRGNRNKSIALLREADPRGVPLNSLRRAIRRAVTAQKFDQAIAYLRMHVKHKPKDAWSRQKLDDLQQAHMGNDALLVRGFPFPARAHSPAYTPNPNRILYTLHNSLPYHSAGYATRTHGLLSELNRTGWDVEGVTRLGYPYDMPGHFDIADVPSRITLGNTTYSRLLQGREIEKKRPLTDYIQRYTASLLELIDKERPALVHGASNHWNGLATVSAANSRGIPSVYEIRGLWEVTRGSRDPDWSKSDMYELMARMETDAARGASKAFTITEALRNEMIDRGVQPEHIEVLPNGVDTERFVPLPPDGDLAEELGLTDETVIGYVGSILDYEGIDLLIDAAKVLSHRRNDFHVLIVGDGPERDRLEHAVTDSGLDALITFTGRVPHEDVERYYSIIDITPFPRLPLPVCEMVSPLKPFEAMAMGKAVVASNVAALSEIVQPQKTGLLHVKGSVESLAHELSTLLDDSGLMQDLGTNGRDWVVAERDWRLLGQRLAETYQTLIV